MIDILPGWTFMEADILRIYSGGPYKGRDGGEIYAITVKLKGDTEAIRSTYRTPLEMNRDLTAITNAWNAWADGAQGKSIRDEFERMRQRLEETEKKLAEWEAKSWEKARAEKKPKTRTGKKKPEAPKRPAEKKQTKKWEPPTGEELIDYIEKIRKEQEEKGEPLDIEARELADKVRMFYQEDDGTWLKGNGKPASSWKQCVRTFINGERDKELTQKKGGRAKTNAFNQFEQNKYSPEEFEQFENSSVAI